MLRWDQEHYDVLEMAVFAGTLPSEALLSGLAILVGITDIEEIEIFKMCLEFWKHWSNQQFLYDRNFVAEAQAQAQVLCVEPASSWCTACRHVCAHGSLPRPHTPPPPFHSLSFSNKCLYCPRPQVCPSWWYRLGRSCTRAS